MKDVVIDRELVRLSTFSVALSQVDEAVKIKIIELLEKNGFQPPSREELLKSLKIKEKNLVDILKLMVKEGSLVRISESIHITSSLYKKMIENLKAFFNKKPEMTVAEFRDILNTSRKYALPFLEYLDSNKVTLRVGEIRKLLLK
jgi:selenocysteine-specific elongation factor